MGYIMQHIGVFNAILCVLHALVLMLIIVYHVNQQIIDNLHKTNVSAKLGIMIKQIFVLHAIILVYNVQASKYHNAANVVKIGI